MIRFPRPTLCPILAAAILLASALLIFARLGHYPLWDDEANTALIAKGVWRTGDTSAVVGRNIVAYRHGSELVNLRARYLPPLQFYVAAPFVGPGGPSSFRARLPFAIFGLAAIGLMLWWLSRTTRDPLAWVVTGLAIVTNVSLMLYARQCRYYAVAIFFTLAVAYLYQTYDGRRRKLFLFVIASLGLFAANYLNFVALYACLALDYLAWGRRRYRLPAGEWLLLFVPQIILGGAIFWIWNPLGHDVTKVAQSDGFTAKLQLLWWNVRDLAACEFAVIPLLLAAPIVYRWAAHGSPLLRFPTAAAVYLVVITALSPQSVTSTTVADVRYLAPLIPLGIATGAAVIITVSKGRWWIALPLALLAFGTNWLNFGRPADFPQSGRQFNSTICQYLAELWRPPGDPYTPTVAWINAHVHDGESIWVVPPTDFQTYPLMYHAPHAVYAWQLEPTPAGQFAHLDPIHFMGSQWPDFIFAAGPGIQTLTTQIKPPPDVRYTLAAKLDCPWKDLYRPELIWRRFTPLPNYDHDRDVIYIFKRVPPSSPTLN